MDLEPGTRFGPYEIVSRLGAGGMGVVYRARDTRLGRDVAIKVLRSEFANDSDRLRRFEQEARATSSLNHPNILSVFDVGTWEGAPYIVSELLEGSTLRERLRTGILAGKKGLDFANQVARGLAAAHQKGIIHRDLKPENLFLMKDGRAKILDFGLAKLTEPAGAESDLKTAAPESDTKTGRILGTAGYMSPEQVRGEPADPRSDIFSLGAILYESFSGQRAFRGPSMVETLNAILTSEPPEIQSDEIPPGLETIISHCLDKDPDNRFQTAQDLAFNLESVRESSPATASRQWLWRRSASRNRSRILRSSAIAAIVALSVVALAIMIARRPRPAAPPATYTRLTFREGNVSDARFAPDGQTVIYGAAWEGKPMEIFTARIDGPESRRLGLPPGAVFSVSPQGMLAISEGCELNFGRCRGTLAEVSLTGGAPRKIAENVDWADWSPDGKELVIVRLVDGFYRLESPIGHVLYQSAGWISNPRFSPDGRHIAFADHPDFLNTSGSIDVVDRAGSKTTLTEGWAIAWGLAWRSNDEIWFNGNRTGRIVQIIGVKLDKSERAVVATAGTQEVVDIARNGNVLLFRTNIRGRMFAGAAAEERELSWFDWSEAADISADGRTILFYEAGDATGGAPQVFTRSVDGSDATGLGSGRALALSPDGRWALAVDRSPEQHLVLLPTGAGEKRVLPAGEVGEFYAARFFPDGHRLLISGEGKNHVPGSWIQAIDQGTPLPIGAKGFVASLVSPDGKRLAAYGPDGDFYVLPTEGGEPVPLKGVEPGERLLQWSEDGRSLFVRGKGDEAVDIDRLDLGTGRRAPWKRIAPSDRVGMIGVDVQAVCISRDGKSYAYTNWTALMDLYSANGLR